jgi:flagellar motor switch protein FliM
LSSILSQSEIDELLSALAAGENLEPVAPQEEPHERIRKYDFATANKFPKEQIRTLQFIHETYAGRLSSFLAATLRAICDVEVASIEEQTFAEFNNSIPSPVVLAIFDMPPLQGNALLEISSAVAYEIVSRLFGGPSRTFDTGKPFTEIETAVLTRVIRQMLGIMEEAWEKVVHVHATLGRIETSAQFTQIAAANDPIAIVTMNVTIGETTDLINICIPHVAVQPISKQLTTRTLYAGISQGEESEDQVHEMNPTLAHTKITLHAVFDDTPGTVRDILGLQVGDVIRLDHPLERPITVKVAHLPKFKGSIGIKKSRYAVRLTKIMEEELDG